MPTIFIDDKPYEVKKGQNILEAALSHGLDLPYFCWHPALGSVGACRQCAVQQYKDENDKTGRLVMSCMTGATPGMRVSINHEGCTKFRANVIEWMMLDHPHDCPVCDEGGECHLQDMTVMSGHNHRRFRFKKRTFENQDLGPLVDHEMNRCITCYRCVRYYGEVAGGTDLHAFSSRNRVYFGRHEAGVLESEFSGNLVEVCPTGVFTDKPFKAYFNRKWDLQMAPSVCQLCSLGCNIIPGERFGTVRRVQNKFNHEINDYFLCDKGRFGHSFVNSEKRIVVSSYRPSKSAPLSEVTNQDVTNKVQDIFHAAKNIVGIASPRASLEANFALQSFVGAENFYDGLSYQDSLMMAKVKEILEEGPALTASIQNVKEADAVLVLGEDIINTSSRLALAIRQNVILQAQKKAGEIGIESWNDAAVRNYARDKSGTIFVATTTKNKLEDVAESIYAHPDDLACLGFAIAHELNSKIPLPKNLSKELTSYAKKAAEVLKTAKNPVVISGTALQSEALLEASANVAWALCEQDVDARICLAVSEANSMGLNLLNPKPLSRLIDKVEDTKVDVAVVLENDLYRRIPAEQADGFFAKVKNVVTLDSFETRTTLKSDLSVAACTFTEGTGTLVNNEGRVQRYYNVFERKEKISESWRILNEWSSTLNPNHERWKTLDAITDAMGEKMHLFKSFDASVFRENFRIDGKKIPREPQGYSGRTAMHANVTMHEPKPADDIDSPLAHSMEGFQGHPPSTMTPFFWAPGWNSVQSLNKYQVEVGSELKNLVPVIRVFDAKNGEKAKFYDRAPEVFQKNADTVQVHPQYFIFGSEERVLLSSALTKRLASACVSVGPKDAQDKNLVEGSVAELKFDTQTVQLPVVVCPQLEPGSVLMSCGLPDTDYFTLPSFAKISLLKGAL